MSQRANSGARERPRKHMRPHAPGALTMFALVLTAAGLALSACSSPEPASTEQASTEGAATPATTAEAPKAASTPKAEATPELSKLLVEPATGNVGNSFTVTTKGVLPGATVEFKWRGVEGSYVTEVIPDNVQYIERKYAPRLISLGKTVADAQGVATLSTKVPEDHGDIHDIFAVVDGTNVARGGYSIKRTITISESEGPIGAPIKIKITGMSSSYYQSTMAVRWDNMYTGFVSTVTTRGTAEFTIRAAGSVGDHTIQVYPASHGVPYLNSHQGPNVAIFGHLPDKFVYRVTGDNGAPAGAVEWPDAARITALKADSPRTGASAFKPAGGVSASVEPSSGRILEKVSLKVKGLPADVPVELVWVTARGNRASTSGWSLELVPLGAAKTGSDGSVDARFDVPDDLGGWHTVRVLAKGAVVAEAPYYLERSLVGVTPQRVSAGDVVTIQLKGIGWTELDNGIAVTYDNGFVGYACGFNSNGDITLYITATGGPGTHIIDIYPMIYEGHPNAQVFDFAVPQLTALRDNPSLDIGYRLPVFRTAFKIVEPAVAQR